MKIYVDVNEGPLNSCQRHCLVHGLRLLPLPLNTARSSKTYHAGDHENFCLLELNRRKTQNTN